MPTYSYECKQCGHVQDVFHSIAKQPRVKCEECGSACRRLLGVGAGVIFKGSGFYETDYKKAANGGKKDGAPKTETKKDGAAKSETVPKSESKPAAASGGTSKNAD